MTLIVSCLFAGCDSLANKSEDKLSGDDFWAQGNETNAEAFLLSIYNSFRNATMSQRPFFIACSIILKSVRTSGPSFPYV